MNLKALFIALLGSVMFAMPAVAQAPQEVTLTVSSDGPTKEDATKNALRSAIEQAFGAFVSANTTILNDELVKDEIVTVSNGSIKDYKEISAVQTDNGNHFVTLTATVSLPNLISYAKSHGSECEFAGNTFGMEMKLFELQIQNERKVLEDLLKQLEEIISATMSWTMDVSEPVVDGNFYKIKTNIKWGQGIDNDNISLSEIEKEMLSNPNTPKSIKERVLYNAKRKALPSYNEIESFIDRTLSGLSLSKESEETWGNRGMELGIVRIKPCLNLTQRELDELGDQQIGGNRPLWTKPIVLRSRENASYFSSELYNLIVQKAIGFVMKDNTGEVSDPLLLTPSECSYYRNGYYKNPESPVFGRVIMLDYNYAKGTITGSGIFSNNYDFDYSDAFLKGLENNYFSAVDLIELEFRIPKSDIGKYSKFWIESKQ